MWNISVRCNSGLGSNPHMRRSASPFPDHDPLRSLKRAKRERGASEHGLSGWLVDCANASWDHGRL